MAAMEVYKKDVREAIDIVSKKMTLESMKDMDADEIRLVMVLVNLMSSSTDVIEEMAANLDRSIQLGKELIELMKKENES